MTKRVDPPRLSGFHRDETGQMTVEWILLTTLVIIPIGMTIPGIIYMLDLYFYRVAGVISLPFP